MFSYLKLRVHVPQILGQKGKSAHRKLRRLNDCVPPRNKPHFVVIILWIHPGCLANVSGGPESVLQCPQPWPVFWWDLRWRLTRAWRLVTLALLLRSCLRVGDILRVSGGLIREEKGLDPQTDGICRQPADVEGITFFGQRRRLSRRRWSSSLLLGAPPQHHRRLLRLTEALNGHHLGWTAGGMITCVVRVAGDRFFIALVFCRSGGWTRNTDVRIFRKQGSWCITLKKCHSFKEEMKGGSLDLFTSSHCLSSPVVGCWCHQQCRLHTDSAVRASESILYTQPLAGLRKPWQGHTAVFTSLPSSNQIKHVTGFCLPRPPGVSVSSFFASCPAWDGWGTGSRLFCV